MASDAPFDPFNQSFTLLDMQESPHQFGIAELEELITYLVQSSVVFAAQLGGSLVLLIALLLLAKPEKRRSPIFILNALSLSINFILTLLNCLYFTGPFTEIAAILLHDYSRVPQSEYAKSITMTILSLVLLLCAEASLVLQVRVVCVTLRRIHRQALFLVSVLVVLMAAAFRLAYCIENSRSILTTAYTTDLIWLQSATNITTSISLCWFCAVFVAKLAFALTERRKLGLRKFGPMQVIFIMGIQSFIVPGKKDFSRLKKEKKPTSLKRVYGNFVKVDRQMTDVKTNFSNLLAPSIYLPTSQHAFQRPHSHLYFPSTFFPLGFCDRHDHNKPLPPTCCGPALTLLFV